MKDARKPLKDAQIAHADQSARVRGPQVAAEDGREGEEAAEGP